MITAELANGYNRDVFAVPGRVSGSAQRRMQSTDQGRTKLHCCDLAEDLLHWMGWKNGREENIDTTQAFSLSSMHTESTLVGTVANKRNCSPGRVQFPQRIYARHARRSLAESGTATGDRIPCRERCTGSGNQLPRNYLVGPKSGHQTAFHLFNKISFGVYGFVTIPLHMARINNAPGTKSPPIR